MTQYQYWYENDIEMINNAINVSGFTKEVNDWIFEKKIEPFDIF